ncbi:hypothetical protein DLJ82_5465 (plasmid) [Rhizobium leguminosarum]|uniref:Uncharacterized protein n=1 Tax=Rhizobium leguminosarum TaxID=384 RepID=A0A2Z4YP81_RHILE|nr:hypothetical protein DLJ82_5465 [Rhizobium leguminosarum]
MKNGDADLLEKKKRLLSDLCRTRGGVCECICRGCFSARSGSTSSKNPYATLSLISPLSPGSVARRRPFCFEELRLNRRLAGETYISVVPICRTTDGDLRTGGVGGVGEAIDWVVEMRRLLARDMFDYRMQAAPVESSSIDAVAVLMSGFYRSLSCEHVVCENWLAYMSEQLDGDATVLCRGEFGSTAGVAALSSEEQQLAKFVVSRRRLVHTKALDNIAVLSAYADQRSRLVLSVVEGRSSCASSMTPNRIATASQIRDSCRANSRMSLAPQKSGHAVNDRRALECASGSEPSRSRCQEAACRPLRDRATPWLSGRSHG